MVGLEIGFLIASGGGGALPTLGYWLGGLGAILMLLGSIRTFQGIKAGRAFRDGRPYIRS
jgi:hypothetical protein